MIPTNWVIMKDFIRIYCNVGLGSTSFCFCFTSHVPSHFNQSFTAPHFIPLITFSCVFLFLSLGGLIYDSSRCLVFSLFSFNIEIDNEEQGVIGDFTTISDIRITKAEH